MPQFYVTTPIFYVNDAPHIGHAYTMVLADALARYHRMSGDEVHFLTGTDEHGKKVAEAAGEHGLTEKQWTDTTSARFRQAWSELCITNDDFIRTTEERHYGCVQDFFSRIRENGYIRKDVYRGLYCVGCERYLDESELVNGTCPDHKRPPELMDEENYFFELSRFEQPLLEWYDRCPDAVVPVTKRNEAVGFIKGGLADISITRRSISWGVPVPWDTDHVFYVWADALVNYLTAIGYREKDAAFERLWPEVRHVIGKDILRFHCVWWPAMCMAAGIAPPKQVLVHGWLLVSGEKMSKSRLNQIAPTDLAADFGVDALRYHLLRDTPLGADGDFSYERIVERYNADLANNLGNLVSRFTTVVVSKCGGIGPAAPPCDEPLGREAGDKGLSAGDEKGGPSVIGEAVAALARHATVAVRETGAAYGRAAPHEALQAVWTLIREANAALEKAEPWRAEPGSEVDAVMGAALESLRIIAILVAPAMPGVAAEIWRRIGLAGEPPSFALTGWGGYPGGLEVLRAEPIFPRRR